MGENYEHRDDRSPVLAGEHSDFVLGVNMLKEGQQGSENYQTRRFTFNH
jgi:hypothetical protein